MRRLTVAEAVRAALLTCSVGGLLAMPAFAQDVEGAAQVEAEATGEMEEVTVTGRQQSAAAEVLQERIEQPVLVDIVSAEQIARVGDSTVSAALRRLPGVSLVGDQFIYVRGLGERYSSTTLNGAYVPSPDLTRNVIPLDLFPSEIIRSLSVSKGYTANQPAAFGGGNVDIRTLTVPDEPVVRLQVGSGWDTESSDDGLFYPGGVDDRLGTDDGRRQMPQQILDALQTYAGDISVAGIFRGLQRDGAFHTIAEAETLNRVLATSLNRDIQIRGASVDPDFSLEGALGNSFFFGGSEDLKIGVLGLGDYKNSTRNRDRISRSVLEPDTDYEMVERTTNQVALTGSLNVGVEYTRDHELRFTGLYLRNTDDEASITTGYNSNFQQSTGDRFRNYRIRFEERDLKVGQVGGRHVLGMETLDRLPEWRILELFRDLKLDWYYSDAIARTDIPNEVTVSAVDRVDPASGELLSTSIRPSISAADYRFTNLRDDVVSQGWSLEKPWGMGSFMLKLGGGWDYMRKGRSYLQTQLNLGTSNAAADLDGGPGDVFTDANIIDALQGYTLGIGGIGTESYLAGETIDAYFGQLDLTWNDTWRLNAGVRREYFQRISLPVSPLAYGAGQNIVVTPAQDLPTLVRSEEDDYPSAALTWMHPGFWAEEFQLRFGWSRTIARPDLREVSAATYIDPFTEARVRGNPDLATADITNFDLRAEWFFTGGENLTLSAFYKDIKNPIETIEGAGSDDNISLTFVNGESAEVYGFEVEGLKRLSFLAPRFGDWLDSFFVSGNAMIADSKITVGNSALNLTNNEHPLSQASDWVVNVQFGYDSPDNRHNAALVLNGTGKRLFFAGRNGAPDAYEKPFYSVDLVYSYYPRDWLSLRLRAQNLLGDDISIRQNGVTTLTQTLGRTLRLDATMRF